MCVPWWSEPTARHLLSGVTVSAHHLLLQVGVVMYDAVGVQGGHFFTLTTVTHFNTQHTHKLKQQTQRRDVEIFRVFLFFYWQVNDPVMKLRAR